jgi:hypothetical protein
MHSPGYVYIFFNDFSQVCTGVDLSSKEAKRFREEVLPEAVNNMFLVTRRIQARYARIPDRAVSFFYHLNSLGLQGLTLTFLPTCPFRMVARSFSCLKAGTT